MNADLRVARDGYAYSRAEFQEYYQERYADWQRMWENAPQAHDTDEWYQHGRASQPAALRGDADEWWPNSWAAQPAVPRNDADEHGCASQRLMKLPSSRSE